jgi:hypothetical protein
MSDLEYIDFAEIPPNQIHAVDKLYNDESILNTIYNIAVSGLTGGGVIISRDGYQLNDYASRFYAHMWLEFTRKLVLCVWLYGFAPVVFEPHAEFKAIPRILCLTDVSIRIRRTIYSTTEYVFLRCSGANVSSGHVTAFSVGPVGHREPVNGVLVLELDPPDAYGNLRSKMVYAWKEHSLLAHHLKTHLQCVSRMANPPILIDVDLRAKPDVPFNDPTGRNKNGAGDQTAKSPSGTELETRSSKQERKSGQDDEVAGNIVENGFSSFGTIQSTLTQIAGSSADYVQRVERGGYGESLKMAGSPQESRHMVDLVLGYEERLSALFAVPRSFFAQFSAGRSANSPDAREMWRNSQRALKQLICMFLEVVYDHIFIESHKAQSIAMADELLLSYNSDSERVTITLPGIPPEDVLQSWWISGLLKYESYRGYISAMYGIPITDLHEKQQLTLQELNGIKEPTSSDNLQGAPSTKTVVQQEKSVNPKTGVSSTKTQTITTTEDSKTNSVKKRKMDASKTE